MKIMKRDEMNLTQYILYIYKTQIGIGILTLPRLLMEEGNTDGWISIIISYVITIAVSYMIIRIMERFPTMTLFEVLNCLFGRWIGGLLRWVWVIYMFLAAFTVLFTTIFIIHVWILRNTASWIVMAAYLVPLFLVARSPMQIQGRYAEFVFISSLWMYPMLFFPLNDSQLLNLLPVFKEGLLPIMKAVKISILPYLGFELAFFLYPFLIQKKSAFKGIVIANTMSLALYLLVTLVAFVYFSNEGLKDYYWPTLQLLKTIKFTFIERFEIVFLSFYLITLSQTIAPYLHFSTVGMSWGPRFRSNQVSLVCSAAGMFTLSVFYSPSYHELEQLSSLYNYTGLVMAFGFPCLLGLYLLCVPGAARKGERRT
ncbi:hypothetical protein SY83_05915 [Paenibacillus swuensis]|uniref:Uncharacterized protein n=1 Tax=Paenibacillus swuensis TaxID=1178515 RepID=A0A172TG79_9BACL|nr:endospore germination permease [Paenibacillus swuensis]ANE45904.1 hypothetical protein SY83_05915 [Paenibacillus swuensis]